MTAPPPAPRGPAGELVAAVPHLTAAPVSPAGLFALTPAPVAPARTITGSVRPVPAVAIGGVDVAAGPAPDGAWPDLMVVDGMAVRWGREQVLEQPAASTARVALFDPTGVWAAAADLIGRPIELRWTATHPEDGPSARVYFTGRVAGVDMVPHTTRRPDGQRVAGALVTLSCTSLLTDLGNRQPAEDTWPAETVAARRARLAAAAAGVATTVATAPAWDAGPLAATKVDATDVLEQLGLLYNATGADRMVFDPATRAVDWLRRRQFSGDMGLAQLFWDPALRTGVFIQALSIARAAGEELSAPLFIDGQAVGYEEGVSKDMGSRLTRASVGYYDSAAADEARTVTRLIPGADEAIVGERSVTMQTQHHQTSWANAAADDLAGLAANEASGWRLQGPLRWDTRRTGGFETFAQAELLLAGRELFAMYFLQGSWLPTLGIRPVFGVIGGTIEYRRDAWAVEWHNAPVATDNPQPPEITWDHVDAGDPFTVVWDEYDNSAGMHESVTWEDLQYVALGFGVTQLPTDGA